MLLTEVLGYLGTTLVIISFLCHSIIRLRLFNAAGALLITIYAMIHHSWPVVLLDGFIVMINSYQLVKLYQPPPR